MKTQIVTPATGGKASKSATIHPAPTDTGLLRLWHVIGDPARGIAPLVPVSRSSWLTGVKSGKYPQPVRVSDRTVAWRRADIMALLDSFDSAGH